MSASTKEDKAILPSKSLASFQPQLKKGKALVLKT